MTSSVPAKGQRKGYVIEFTQEKIQALRQTVAKGATDAEFEMYLHLAQYYGLDPFKKEIWFIKRVKKIKKIVGKREVWDYPRLSDGSIDYSQAETTIMTSRDGYLTIAQRDPNFAGLKGQVVHVNDQFAITQTLDGEDIKHTYTHKDRGNITGAWAAAFHKERPPVITYVPLNEYYSDSNIWKKNTSAMILKVVESFVLKRQFGITGLVTAEELGDETEIYNGAITESKVNEGYVEAGEQKNARADRKTCSQEGKAPGVKNETETPGDDAGESAVASTGESLSYQGVVTVTSAPAEKSGRLCAAGEDEQGSLILLCGEVDGLKKSFMKLDAGEVINATGQVKENGKRFVLAEKIEPIPF